MLSDPDFVRYSRQIMLPECGEKGIERLQESNVVIVGAGGLGSIVAPYLAGAGLGRLSLIDPDRIELSNLPRQWVYRDSDLGKNKVDTLARVLQQIQPEVLVRVEARQLHTNNVNSLLQSADLVLDCSDNLPTRHCINQACLELGIPWVSGAAIGVKSHCAAFHPAQITDSGNESRGCYRCLYPFDDLPQGSCAQQGVLGPAVGLAASMQASLAMRILLNDSTVPWSQLWQVDQRNHTSQWLTISRDTHCPICQQKDDHDHAHTDQ